MGEVAALRQLVGQVQELWDLYGANAHPLPRWYLLDFEHGSIMDDYCGGRSGYNSELLKIMEANQSPPRKRPRRDRNREKAPSSNKTEVMQQEIWRDFPEDLFETVIARLPVAAIFRFRTVCRKWSSLLGSDSFSHQYSEAPRGLPWFYTITHENANNNVAMYDPSLKKWHHPSVPLTPTKIVIPVASVGGLVCLLDLSHKNFYICNPLMQSLKEIPPRSVQGWSRVAVGMVLNGRSSSDGYKVMWFGNDGTFEVYDSTKNMWSCPGTFPPSIKLPLALNFRSQPVAVGSTVYFMCAEPDGVLSYDGRVMLVGLLCKNAATCVCIWELQKMTLLWKEVDRMPNIWCLEFYGKHMKMTCLGNSGLLMLSLKAKRMNRLVTYNLLKREWQKVPDCVLPYSRKKQWIACGTAFDPVPCALA
uniref:F-box domain-containing protein n=1 Tax=Zea mays TaxID=4577 RepID=A0A804QY99_MAIZE